MATNNTGICNMALGRIGATRITDFDDATDTKAAAIQCRLHFEQTRDALQRSHFWVFNKRRVALSQDTVDPDFEYAYQFLLPSDFLRYRYKYDSGAGSNEISTYSFSIESKSNDVKVLMTDETSVSLIYSALVTDPTKWDPLFTEVLVLKLALKLLTPLAGSDKAIRKELTDELNNLSGRVKALDRNEGAGTRQNEQQTWNDSRLVNSGRNRPTVASS